MYCLDMSAITGASAAVASLMPGSCICGYRYRFDEPAGIGAVPLNWCITPRPSR
jgi:hypothetical protein